MKESHVSTLTDRRTRCVCCDTAVEKTAYREPLCGACAAPGEARSYCAKCGARGAYPFEDFMRVMAEHYPAMALSPGTAVALPACARCVNDGKPSANRGIVRFYGISFD